MELDKIIIGERLRKLREEFLKETRKEFAKRCGITERHIGQIERGEFLIGLKTLNKIVEATGITADYILYGEGTGNDLKIKQILYNIISKSNENELDMYYRFITTINNYIDKKSE